MLLLHYFQGKDLFLCQNNHHKAWKQISQQDHSEILRKQKCNLLIWNFPNYLFRLHYRYQPFNAERLFNEILNNF